MILQARSCKNEPWRSTRKCTLVLDSIKDWPNSAEHYSTLWALGFVTALYGGLHATAWDAAFPSSTERLLWRISSLLIGNTSLWFLVIILPFEIEEDLDKLVSLIRPTCPPWLLGFVVTIPGLV